LEIFGEPNVSVVAFTSKKFNIYNLLDELKQNWDLNAIQNPSGQTKNSLPTKINGKLIFFSFLVKGLHIAVTRMHTKPGVAERFVADVRKAVQSIMKSPNKELGPVVNISFSIYWRIHFISQTNS
jgi:sphinganine-1-phosphate aldolase